MDMNKIIIAKISFVLIILILFFSCAKKDNYPKVCTLEALSGIKIQILDIDTSENLSCNSSAIVSEGEFEETLTTSHMCDQTVTDDNLLFLYGLEERSGIYSLELSVPDYESYFQDDILIKEDECHVIPKELTILVTPLGG